MLDRTDLEQLTEAIRNGFTGKTPTNAASPSLSYFDNFKSKVEALRDAFGNLITTAGGVTAAFQSIGNQKAGVTDTLQKLGSYVPGGTMVTGAIATGVTATREAGKSGLNADILGQAAQANKAGYDDITKFTRQLSETGTALNGIAPTAQRGADALLNLQGTVRNSESSLVKNLQANGMLGEELSKITIISQMNSKANLEDAEVRKKATKNAELLADQIAKTSIITGKHRDTIADELKERMKQPEIMAQMRLMNEDQRAAFMRTQAALNSLGPTITKLSGELSQFGGPVTEDSIMAMAALGPAGRELAAAQKAMKNATTDEEKQRAQLQMQRAQAAVNERTQSASFQRMAAMGAVDPAFAVYGKIAAENAGGGRQASQQAITGKSAISAAQEQDILAQRQLAGKEQRTGETDKGAATGRAIN